MKIIDKINKYLNENSININNTINEEYQWDVQDDFLELLSKIDPESWEKYTDWEGVTGNKPRATTRILNKVAVIINNIDKLLLKASMNIDNLSISKQNNILKKEIDKYINKNKNKSEVNKDFYKVYSKSKNAFLYVSRFKDELDFYGR